MIITNRFKTLTIQITSITDFQDFIISHKIITDFKNFNNVDKSELADLISIIDTDQIVSLRFVEKYIKRWFIYPSKFQFLYWYIRGYTEEESNLNVSLIQKNNSKKKSEKFTIEDHRRFSVRCVEYWIDKGFSMDDALLKIKDIQDTRSYKKNIEKYGLEKGTQIVKDINEKWQSALKSKPIEEINRINKDKGNCRYKLKGRKFTESHIQNLKNSLLEYHKNNDVYNKGKTLLELFGPDKSLEIKIKTSEIRKGKTPWNKGLNRYIDDRINKYAIKIPIKFKFVPNYNKHSIKLIEDFGLKNGYNFQHAEKGGEYYIKELGYWVDAYDIEKNTVLEIDEKHHYDIYGNLKEVDVLRQKQIVEFLQCDFIRIRI